MDKGKLEISLLEEILKMKGYENVGIISSGRVGTDAAALNISLAKQKVQEYYEDSSEIFLVIKSDPVTFPTSEPGRYVVIVNANDISCTGALPYGFLASIIAPPDTSFSKIELIQKQIHQQCLDLGISILGGHTEISESVQSIVISGHMIGFVTKNYYVPNKLTVGDKILLVGEIGAEGMGIIISEAKESIKRILDEEELEEGIRIGERLSLTEIANIINKEFRPVLIHDATEGGVYGALSEILAHRKVGILLNEEPTIHPVLEKLSKWLQFDPYRLISSGLIILATDNHKATQIREFLIEYQIPCSIIGTVTSEKETLKLKEIILDKPKGDEIINALRNLEGIRSER